MATINASGNLVLKITEQADNLSGGVSSKISTTNISKLINTGAATLVKEYTGIYTPNNDYVVVHSFTPSAQANLILVITDKPCGVYLASSLQQVISSVTIDGLFLVRLKDFTNFPQATLILDGRVNTNTAAVTQNQAISYYVAVIDDNSMAV